MNWMLRLYPPSWQRRYGAELGELVAAQSFSIGAALDLLAGAVDAWLHRDLVALNDRDSQGGTMLVAKCMRLKCAGPGSDVTSSDRRKSTVVNIGGTLVLVLPWLLAVRHFHGNGYVMALLPMTYTLPYLLSLRYTSLRGRSGRAQAILITALSASLAVFLLFVGWIITRL